MNQENDVQAIERLHSAYQRVRGELEKIIVGQHQPLDELLYALFARGHCLLVGVPGLAKTLMIRTLADALSLEVQPDPVHAGSDAGGHHWHRDHRGGPQRRRATRVSLPGRTGLRQHCARR